MSVQPRINDANGDIAALVYSSGDRPDLVLSNFARHLADCGQRICGLIQFRDSSFAGTHRKIMILDRWEVVDIARTNDVVGDSRCHIDGQWVDHIGAQVQTSIRRGVDVVIVNRFGPLEAAGRGFCDAIAVASETETPLVIAVPEFEFQRWTRFSNGMTVKLDCTLSRVLGWWHGVSARGLHLPVQNARACELFK